MLGRLAMGFATVRAGTRVLKHSPTCECVRSCRAPLRLPLPPALRMFNTPVYAAQGAMVFRIAAPKRALGEYASAAKDWEVSAFSSHPLSLLY